MSEWGKLSIFFQYLYSYTPFSNDLGKKYITGHPRKESLFLLSFSFLHSLPFFFTPFSPLLLLLSIHSSFSLFFSSSLAFLIYLALGIMLSKVSTTKLFLQIIFSFYFETRFSPTCLEWSWTCSVVQTSLRIMRFPDHILKFCEMNIIDHHCAVGCLGELKNIFFDLNHCDQIHNANNFKDWLNLILQRVQ